MLTFRQIQEDRDTTNSGEGDKLAGFHRVDHTGKEDMEAFDQLGPRTRAVLRQMPLQFSAKMTLDQVGRMGMHPITHDVLVANHLKAAADHAHEIMRNRPEMNTQRPEM